jgi:probable addiction module antidote protein
MTKTIKKRTKLKTLPWDPTRYLKTEKDCMEYLDAALEEGDPTLIAAVLGDIARAKGMTNVARRAGLGRESLYKALSRQGDPKFGTIMKVISAVGMKLRSAA